MLCLFLGGGVLLVLTGLSGLLASSLNYRTASHGVLGYTATALAGLTVLPLFPALFPSVPDEVLWGYGALWLTTLVGSMYLGTRWSLRRNGMGAERKAAGHD